MSAARFLVSRNLLGDRFDLGRVAKFFEFAFPTFVRDAGDDFPADVFDAEIAGDLFLDETEVPAEVGAERLTHFANGEIECNAAEGFGHDPFPGDGADVASHFSAGCLRGFLGGLFERRFSRNDLLAQVGEFAFHAGRVFVWRSGGSFQKNVADADFRAVEFQVVLLEVCNEIIVGDGVTDVVAPHDGDGDLLAEELAVLAEFIEDRLGVGAFGKHRFEPFDLGIDFFGGDFQVQFEQISSHQTGVDQLSEELIAEFVPHVGGDHPEDVDAFEIGLGDRLIVNLYEDRRVRAFRFEAEGRIAAIVGGKRGSE